MQGVKIHKGQIQDCDFCSMPDPRGRTNSGMGGGVVV